MARGKVKSPEIEFEEAFEEIAGKDCPPVDTSYLKMIEDGDILLSDDLFLDLVKESSAYLRTRPFQDKVTQWQLEENHKMLNRIQTALKPERRGRKATKTEGFKNFEILSVYLKNVKLISDFKKEHPGRPGGILNKLFKESHPASELDFRLHRSPSELAYDLTTKELNISERTLRKIKKYVHPLAHNQEVIKKQE